MEQELKTISIACESKSAMNIDDMRDFQGNLKTLLDVDYEKLKGEIIELGFSYPIQIWQTGEQNYILDGHQRRRVLLRMREEGYEIPEVPVGVTFADTYKEAKMKLLGGASQYGRVVSDGLYEFMTDADLTVEEIRERVRFAEVDLDLFNSEFYEEPGQFNTDGAADPDSIGGYDAEKDTFSIRINDVPPQDKETVIDIINAAFNDTEYHYKAEAF